MREENYFEKKLATCKETLAMAQRRVEHLDIQMQKLDERYNHDKNLYNDQTKHMQNIISDMEKRIPELEKKLKKGYTTIDLYTGKNYTSFKERHIDQLEAKLAAAKEAEHAAEKLYKRKQELKKKKREKLSEQDKEIIEAQEIRESLQGEDELKEVYERQLESLQKQIADSQAKIAELREETEIKKAPMSESYYVKPEEITEEKAQDYTTLDTVIEDRELASRELREFADELNNETEEIKLLRERHPGWIEKYNLEEGGQAIWQGRITNGFRVWLDSKGFKIGD